MSSKSRGRSCIKCVIVVRILFTAANANELNLNSVIYAVTHREKLNLFEVVEPNEKGP